VDRAIRDVFSQLLPYRHMDMLEKVLHEGSQQTHTKIPLLTVSIGVLWAAFNGMWAMVDGLNTAYQTKEGRSFVDLAITIAGLPLSLAATVAISVSLIFSTQYIQRVLRIGAIPLNLLECGILIVALSFWFAILYLFGPSLKSCRWQWSRPGAVCASIDWIAATFGARIYFDRINDYSSTYSHMNGVVMFLLWLYITNGAILIGGELNSEIEKAIKGRTNKTRADWQQGASGSL
jgi:membrane protein